jgi:hypothetical protein
MTDPTKRPTRPLPTPGGPPVQSAAPVPSSSNSLMPPLPATPPLPARPASPIPVSQRPSTLTGPRNNTAKPSVVAPPSFYAPPPTKSKSLKPTLNDDYREPKLVSTADDAGHAGGCSSDVTRSSDTQHTDNARYSYNSHSGFEHNPGQKAQKIKTTQNPKGTSSANVEEVLRGAPSVSIEGLNVDVQAYYCPKDNGWVVLGWGEGSPMSSPSLSSFASSSHSHLHPPPATSLPDTARRLQIPNCLSSSPKTNLTHHYHYYPRTIQACVDVDTTNTTVIAATAATTTEGSGSDVEIKLEYVTLTTLTYSVILDDCFIGLGSGC